MKRLCNRTSFLSDALEIEGGDGGLERTVAARAFFKKRGVERRVAVAHLWDGKLQGADSGFEGSWFESVGVAIALAPTLVRAGPDVILALDEDHR